MDARYTRRYGRKVDRRTRHNVIRVVQQCRAEDVYQCKTATMNILLCIILGGIAGWLASMVMKTDEQQGIIMNVIVGIVGALIGGFIFGFFGASGVTGFNLYSLLVAFVGSIVLLWLYGLITRRT